MDRTLRRPKQHEPRLRGRNKLNKRRNLFLLIHLSCCLRRQSVAYLTFSKYINDAENTTLLLLQESLILWDSIYELKNIRRTPPSVIGILAREKIILANFSTFLATKSLLYSYSDFYNRKLSKMHYLKLIDQLYPGAQFQKFFFVDNLMICIVF